MATEGRLIDADAFLKSLVWECGDVCERIEYSDCLYAEYGFSRKAIRKLMQNFPTIDAVEVVHGRWKQTKEPLGFQEVDCVECSNCHELWVMDEEYEFEDFLAWKYCPNCGAKMDGDGNG